MGTVQMTRLPGSSRSASATTTLLVEGLGQIDELELIDSGHDGPIRASHYCLVAVLRPPFDERREQVIEAFKERGVGTSVYYPKALPDTAYYRDKYGYAAGLVPGRVADQRPR